MSMQIFTSIFKAAVAGLLLTAAMIASAQLKEFATIQNCPSATSVGNCSFNSAEWYPSKSNYCASKNETFVFRGVYANIALRTPDQNYQTENIRCEYLNTKGNYGVSLTSIMKAQTIVDPEKGVWRAYGYQQYIGCEAADVNECPFYFYKATNN